MGSNCCKGDAAGKPLLRSSSSIYNRSRAGAKLDDRFKPTDGAGGVRLTISTVSTEDSGVYTLQASNAAGKDTTRVRLEVSPDEKPTGEDPPTFLRRLQDLTVKVGTRTRFLVEIVSSTECRVTWYRNERRLLEAERIALVRDGNFWCADISAVSVDDAGRWTCTAENVGGRASCSAHLNVLVPKAYKRPEFVEELRALLTEQGTVSLECKVVGVPTPVLRWFKDSREIKAGDVFALTANAEDPTSLGTYTCEAVNCMGRAYSSSKVHVIGRSSREGSSRPTAGGHVALEPPPIFTKELEDQFVRICEPLTLSCNIVVPPWPRSIVWYNKEGKIEPSEKYRVLEDGVGGYLVEVPSAEWPDEGEWKCVATSSAGRIGITACYVSMDVPKNYRKPRFMENLQAVLTEEGLVSFECKVVGFPTPVLSWFKDGQELKPGDVYQLTGTNSLGSYCCIARNCMGLASSSAELTVEDIQNQLNEEEKLQLFSKNQAPKFLQGLKSVEAKIDEPFRFTIKVAIPPEPTVLWYRDDQPVDESSRCHLGKEERGVFFIDIQSLEFMDQAEWKCVAMNDFGHSVTSCFLKLIIPRHYKKPRFLENLQAILSDEGAVNLECKVIGVPQPVLKWYKDGEELKPGDIHRIISGQDGTCCLGTYTCEAQNCMGIAASSASLLGFEDSIKTKGRKKEDEQTLQRNLSLSTIHEERTSQMYDTPVGDITLDDKGEISFSFDGKEVSVSLYETPDLTEEEALQIVEMYADQLSENVTEHNVVELPPLRFVKETSTSGNLLMEAIIIDVSPEYFTSPEEDLRTEADVEDISIADENGPPQLSLDQEIDGEDYLEKTMALLSDEKANFPKKTDRKKSDSQKSADDYFSLSRDQSLSDEKKEDDTQALSESDLQSFASAHSAGKVKSKPSIEDGQESSDITKTVLLKEDLQTIRQQNDTELVMKNKHERNSRSSRRSSSSSEISLNNMREDVIDGNFASTLVVTVLDQEKTKAEINSVNSTLTKLINDVQVIERDIILKSELMPTAATASRSLEIINSLITPLSEIHSITEAIKGSISESLGITTSLFNRLAQPLSILQQSLTIIEKCIDLQSENKTLVKKTCTNIIEKCAADMNKLAIDINSIVSKDCPFIEYTCVSSLQKTNNEILKTITCSVAAIKEYKEVSEKIDSKLDKITPELKHLQKTQKAVYELRNPLQSLLDIADVVDISGCISLENVTNTQIILNDMSTPIQALQTALEQIEFLSVTETQSSFQKYNTEIMETVMDSVIKLRTSFEQLSVEAGTMENVEVLKKVLVDIKHNINEISTHLDKIEAKIGPFDVLQSENKLEALQKMAQILINLENNLVILDIVPCLKMHMADFHKNLTKVLEHVIESNDATKYLTFLEICDGINRLNSLIKNIDANDILSLAGISNNLKIIQANVKKNEFTSDLNFSINSNVTDLLVDINETMNHADTSIYSMISENLEDFSIKHYEEGKLKIVLEQIEKTISSISNVVSLETTKDLDIKQAFIKIIPTLEEIKCCVASLTENVNEQEENISDMSNYTFTQAVANPLCELNHGISVLNQMICEKALDYSENEIKVELVTPLLELRNALEILQQDVISQNEENVNSRNIISSVANAVQSIQSCIIMIQEQDLLENVDELSTLEDISAIKTSADILCSDHLLSPSVHEITTEINAQVPTKFETQIVNSVSVQILRNLNDHILILQRPEIVETLDVLSKHDEYFSIQSIATGINTIHCAIEDILHPVTLEESQELSYYVSPTQLTAIIQPVQELHEYLSVIDINNILIEGIIKTDETKCLSQYLSKLEHCLRDSIDCLHVAIETADVTLEISTQIEKLRKLCVELKDNLDTAKDDNIVDSSDLIILDNSLTSVLDTTNCNQKINIARVKLSLERLQQNIASVQDEMLGFAVENSVVLHHETEILKSVADIENTIASLAVLQFINIGQISEFNFCDSHRVGKEVNESKKIENIIETIENCIQQLPLDMPNNNNLMPVKDFVKIFKDEITLLSCLFHQKPTPKRIIKMLQLFYDLTENLKQYQLNQEMSGTAADYDVASATLEEGLQNIQVLLLEVLDTQKNLVFNIPISNITNVEIILNEILETNKNASLYYFVKLLMNTIESLKPCINNIYTDIVKELKSRDVILAVDDDTDKNFELLYNYLSEKTENKEIEGELDFSAIFRVIQKHANCKHVKGTGKKLIYIKCFSDCLNVLKQTLIDLESKKRVLNAESTSSTDYELNKLLIELSGPFEIFYKKIMNISNENLQITDKSNILKDSKLLELQEEATSMATVAEKILKCENLVICSDCSTKTLAKDFVSKIHSIEKSLENLESAYSVQMKLNIQPIKEIEKIISTLLTEEVIREENRQSREKIDSLLQHMEHYIEIIEIVEEVSAVIKLDEFKKSTDIVRELRDSITCERDPDTHLNDSELNIREEQMHLIKNLQKALTTLQTDALESEQELVPHISDDIRQHIIEVVSDLQNDLIVLTNTPVVLEKSELSESVKPIDQNYITLIREEENILSPLKENQNEQLTIINSERNLEQSLNIICTDLTCDFPKIKKIEETPLHIEVSSATNLEIFEEKQSLDLKSDIDLINSNIQELSAKKFDQIRELLIHHINDYLCKDIIEDIKKLLPYQNFDQLEQSLRIAVEVRDNAVSEGSDPLAQQVFLKKQLELVLNLQEVMLRIHCENLYDVNDELLKPQIENKSLLTAKSVVQNLLSSLQMYVALLNTIIQAEVLTDDSRIISNQPCEEVVSNSTIDELKICDKNISIKEDPALTELEEYSSDMESCKSLNFVATTESITDMNIIDSINVQEETECKINDNARLNEGNILLDGNALNDTEIIEVIPANENADKEQSNVVLELETLLQEVNETLHLSENDPVIQDSDGLQDILEEVQTVILKLKCDFDGSTNDTLNENIEDLECNVRSVQLQINENCPPALLKEACANLQTLAACINNVCNTQSIFSEEKNSLRACTDDAKQALDLLDEVFILKVDINSDNIILNLKSIKDAMKYLNSCFMDDAESLIFKGIEVLRLLNDIEDKVFALEKELEANNEIDVIFRDSIIAATHSIYGSISNMRSKLCSIQKKYMYDNYGKPTDNFLKSIKNVNVILSYDKNDDWKKFAKSLHTILKHFEDIKFYINFDKTARLPSDSAFTKIILSELRNILSVVVLQNTKDLDMNLTGRIEDALNYVVVTLNSMENRTTLEVKEKIPIFMELSMQMYDITNQIKILLKKSIDNINEPSKVNEELSEQEESLRKIPLGNAEYDEKHAQKVEELKNEQVYIEKSDIQITKSHDLSFDINQNKNKINTHDQKEIEISTLESIIDSIVALQNDNVMNEISQDQTQDIKNEHINIDIADQVEIKLPDTITTETGNFESGSITADDEIQNKVEEITILDTPEKNILVRKEEKTHYNTGTIDKENVLDINTMISGSSLPDIGMKHENEISTIESSVDSLVALQNDNVMNEISQDQTKDFKNEHLNIDIADQEVEIKLPDTITTDTGNFESGSTAADEIQNIVEEITILNTPEKNILVRKEEETHYNTGTIGKENVVNTMISGSSLPDIGMKYENEISIIESSVNSLVALQNDSELNKISQDKTQDIKNEHINIDIIDQEIEIKQPDTITTDTGKTESGSIKAADEIQNIVEGITIFDSPNKNILVSKEEGTYYNTDMIEKENVLDVNTMISGSSLPDIGMKHENKMSTLESSIDSIVVLQNNNEINEISQDTTRDIQNEHFNIDIVDQEIEIKQPDTITTDTGNTELGSIKAADEIRDIVEGIAIFDSPVKNILVSNKDEGTDYNTGTIENENFTLKSNIDSIVALRNGHEVNEISQVKTRNFKIEHLNIDIADQEIEIKLPDTITTDTGNIESSSIMAANEIQNIVEEITTFDTPDNSILVSKDEETYNNIGIIEKENVLDVNTMISGRSLPDIGMKHATDSMQESVEKETQKKENVIDEEIATVYPNQYENDNFTFEKQDEESEKIVPNDINTEHDNIRFGIGIKNINNNNTSEESVNIKTENEMTSVETNENKEQVGEDLSSSFLTKQFQAVNLTLDERKEESDNQLHIQIRKPSEPNNVDIKGCKNIEKHSKIQCKEEISSNEIKANVTTFPTKNEIEIDRDITSKTSNQVASQTNEKVEQTAVSPGEALTSSVLNSSVTESLHTEKAKEEKSTTTAKQLTPEDYKSDIALPLKQQNNEKVISLDSLQYTEQINDDVKDIETKINDITGKTEEIQQYKKQELDVESQVESFKVEEDLLIGTITDTESKFAESQEVFVSAYENVQSRTEFKDDPKKEAIENDSNDIDSSESTDPKIIEIKADDFQGNLHKVGAKELDINDTNMFEGEEIEKSNVLKTVQDINVVKDGHKSEVDITAVEYDRSTPLNSSKECTKDSQKAECSMIEKMRQSDVIKLEEVPLSIFTPKMVEIAQNIKTENQSEMISPNQQKTEKRKIKYEQCVESHIKQSEPTEKKLEDCTQVKDNEIFSKNNEEQHNSKIQKTLMGIENVTQEEKIIRDIDKSMTEDTEMFGDLKEKQKNKLSSEICESKNDEEQVIDVVFTSKEILNVDESVIIDKIIPESKKSDITGSNQSQITKVIKKEKENENQLSRCYDQPRDTNLEEHSEDKELIQSTLTNNNETNLHDKEKENRSRTKDTVQEKIESKQPMKKFDSQESLDIEKSKELMCSIKIGDSTEATLLGNQSESGDLKLEKENIEPNIKSESEKAEIEAILQNTANKIEVDSNTSNQTTNVNKENIDGISLKEKLESVNEEQGQTQETLEKIENLVMPDTKYEKQDEKPKLKAKQSIKTKDNEKRHRKKLEEANSQGLEKSRKSKSRIEDNEFTEKKEEVEHEYSNDMIPEENGNIKKPFNSLGEHTKVEGDKNNEQEHSYQQIPEEIFLHEATKEKEASAGLINCEKNDTQQNIPEEILQDEPTEAAYLRDNQQQKKIEENKKDEHIEILHRRGKCTLDEEKIEKKNTDRNPEEQKLVVKENIVKSEKGLGVTHHIETGILNVELKVQEDKPKGEEEIPIRHPNYSLQQQKNTDAGKNEKEIKLTNKDMSPVNKSNEFEILKRYKSTSDKHISLIEEGTGLNKLKKTEADFTEFQVDEKHTLAEDYNLHDPSAYYSDELFGTVEDKIANNNADILQNNILSRKETKLNFQVKKHKEIKQRPSFIDHSEPDYGLEFARPPGYSTKSLYIDNLPMEIKTKSKSPTIYRAQTIIHESQLKSSLPPNIDQRSNISEGRTEHKQRSNTTSDWRSTISDKRGSYPRDFKRKPVFSTYLTDRTAVESSRVKLTCSVLSTTDPEISWYKNGVLLDNKHKCRVKYVDGLITLEILNAVPSDSGEYSCTVKNENGSITSSANLKVYPGFEASPIPPTFTRSIRDFYHSHENELVLECRIRGQPLPTITWLKDNIPIILNERYQAHYLADGDCRLTILSPNEDDSGKYTCKAENSMWSDQITHEVYFTSKGSRLMRNITTSENIRFTRQATDSRRPHFTNVLSDHKVVSGGTIGLQVEICGSPTRVEWLREGRSVTETYSNAQTYIDRGLYTLALSDVTEKESGLYTCRAWSTQGPVEMNASITVVQPNQFNGKPATIISRPVKDLLISVGEDLNISFRVQGEPKPKVFFMKGIRDISNNQRVCKMTSDDYVKFTLKRSVISDAGTYCVFVRNAYGCDRAFVTVVIRQRASSDHLISDWTYPMDDLAISVVDRNYQSVPDRIPSEPSTVDGGNNWVSLAWPKPVSQVKAPILAYKVECWLLGKEGGARWVELGITPRNCFDAFNLKQGEEYHFRVTPRNRYGWGESVQTSTPIGIGLAGDRPEFIEILPGQLKVLVGETAILYCSFKGNPVPDIVWMKNGHEVEEETERVIVQLNESNTSLQINDIKIEDEGRYSCEATNVHGRSSTYSRMAVITDRQIWAADAKLKRERSNGENGEYPPQFTMRLRDRRVQATYPVRLTCQVIGSPSPLVTWFKDGEEVSVDNRRTTSKDEYFYTLEIAPTTLDDGGVYEAMARNGSGAISCRCNLVVDKGIRAYIAPEFCCGFEPLYRVCEGDELRISAVVEAYPSVGVTWYRDGVRLRPSRRAIMTLDCDGQIELALASVATRDAGVYTCTASNEVGRASTSGKVEVVKGEQRSETPKVPPIVVSPDLPYSKEPMFIKKPRSSEAREGDTVIIECEVIGDPKPEVYWLRDFLKPDYYRDASHFKRVGAGPAYRFEIPHAKFDYTGAYSIVAKNVHGEAKAIISLQILAKDSTCSDDTHNIRYGRVEVIPRFEKELTDLLCYDGDAIEFECRVSGNPEPDIRWFHYTEVLPECPDFETSYDLGTARLKIKHVTADDEGTYSCEASNNLGKATSSACLVIYPPGEPNTLSQSLRRPQALLSASSTPRSTPRTTPARSLSRTPGPDHRRLCSPSREIAPKFYTYPYNRVVEEGDTVVFQCAVKGLPPPWATWDKDGIIITPTARISIREKDDVFRMLEIEQVTVEDVGLYRVTLENDYGRAEASARLEVISQTGKFYGSRSYSVSPRKCLPYRRRTPSLTRQD